MRPAAHESEARPGPRRVPEDGRRDLPFGPRMAQMLMAVAAKPRLSNTNPAAYLPPSITRLYLLSRLDDVTYRRALARGDTFCEMDRRPAGGLLAKAQRSKKVERAAEQNIGRPITLR
jgi:hypothetical protein